MEVKKSRAICILLSLTSKGVSGSDKIDESENSNRTKWKKYRKEGEI